MTISTAITKQLRNGKELLPDTLVLNLPGFGIGVRSNSRELLDRLQEYFGPVLGGEPQVIVEAIETESLDLDLQFEDWRREPGKTGRKDAVHNFDTARLIKKVRTGMLFFQGKDARIASGPCLKNSNQIINFINNQYINKLQQDGALICHASGVVVDGDGLAIAGFSGGGKSTLMLHLLEDPNCRFLTNDRLFVRNEPGKGLSAFGVPKWPRVNPGTIMSLPRLNPILANKRLQQLGQLPVDQLWQLEEKYDVDLVKHYGPERIQQTAPLKALVLLNWNLSSPDPCHCQQIEIADREDLLPAVMKTPGPFYHSSDGKFLGDNHKMQPKDYLERFKDIEVWELSGRVDFEFATSQCNSILQSKS